MLLMKMGTGKGLALRLNHFGNGHCKCPNKKARFTKARQKVKATGKNLPLRLKHFGNVALQMPLINGHALQKRASEAN